MNKLYHIIAVLLCLIPFFCLILFTSNHYINVPYVDQWGLVPLLEKYLQGTITFEDLWAQKVAHRILFPKLIILSLAKASHWNIAYEIVVILTLGFIVYLIIVWQLVKTYRQQKISQPFLWINALFLSVLIFSFSQYANWLWGIQIQLFLNMAASVGGFFILSSQLDYKRLIAGIALGFVATHSFANGVVYWIVGLVPVIVAQTSMTGFRKKAILIWLAGSVVSLFSFFYGYIPQGGGYRGIIDDWTRYIIYVFVYLGNPVITFKLNGAIIAGMIGLLLFCFLSVYLVMKHDMRIKDLVPYFCFACYAIGSAAMTAIGRGGLYKQALVSRYITFGQLLWVANITLLCVAFSKCRKVIPNKTQYMKGFSFLSIIVVIMIFISYGYMTGIKEGKRLCNSAREAGNIIQSTYPAVNINIIKRLNWFKPKDTRERLDVLYKYKLSLFRHARVEKSK